MENFVRIYGTKIEELADPEVSGSAVLLLDEDRRAKASAFRFEKDKYLSLAAGLLRLYAISETFNMNPRDLKFGEAENKKPYVIGKEGICHNISHSGDIVICAVSDHEVGCDVEEIKDPKANVAGRFFTAQEQQTVEQEGREGFFRIWTLKESFMKATGLGLSLPMKDFSINIQPNGEIKVTQKLSDKKYIFKEYDAFEGYKCSVCSQTETEANLDGRIIMVSVSDIIKKIVDRMQNKK